MVSTIFANLNRPGVFLTEDTAGYRVPELASFNTVYMVGSSETGDYVEPALVTSLVDFTNQFGASPSATSVQLYFRNDPNGKLFFIRTPIAKSFTVTVDSIAAGTVPIIINDVTVNTVLTGSETLSEARAKYIEAINLSSQSSVVVAYEVPGDSDAFRIYNRNSQSESLTVTSASGDLTIAEDEFTAPQFNDFIYTIGNSFDVEEDWEQGYLIAPEAFATLSQQSERLAVGNALEDHCSNKEFDWVAFIDCGDPTYTTVQDLQNEGIQYTSPQGHLAYYAPYVVTLEGVSTPTSPAIAGVATLRNRTQGYQQPPAGARFAVNGVTGVSQSFNNTQQSVLNPQGINLVRYLRNKGVVVWAARTRSGDEFYKFVHVRVIMSAINGTLRQAYDFDLFSIVDGRGALLSRLANTARSVCRRFWLSDALFGATEEDAFEVRCDFENNSPDDLENGNVVLEVYVAPVPMLEKLLIRTFRVPIGQVQSAAEAGRRVSE